MSELSVDITANTAAAVANVKKLGQSFDDTSTDMEKLVDVGHDLGKSNDDIARDLQKIDGRPFEEIRREVDKAEDSLNDMGDEADDTRKSLDRLSDAGDDIGDKTTKGIGKAKDGLGDFKSEAASTARESAASFDGSAESIGDAFQEIAANAFAGFGPAGAAAGTAAALGIGAVLTALNEQQAKLDELKENFADMYRSAAEEGRTYLDEAQIQSGVLDILFDPAKREDALKTSQLIGSDLVTIARAEAGSREDIAIAIDLANQKAAELQTGTENTSGTTSVWAAGVQGVAADYQKTLDMLNANSEAATLAAESAARGEEQVQTQIQRTRDASQANYEAMAARYAQPINVKLGVDDSAVRNYVAPTIWVNARVRTPTGIMDWQ